MGKMSVKPTSGQVQVIWSILGKALKVKDFHPGYKPIAKAWSIRTFKSYEPLFKQWDCWCSKRNSTCVSEVENFLASLKRAISKVLLMHIYRSAFQGDGLSVG